MPQLQVIDGSGNTQFLQMASGTGASGMPFYPQHAAHLFEVGGAAIALGAQLASASFPVAIASDQQTALGQALMSASLPVAIASDQTPVSVGVVSGGGGGRVSGAVQVSGLVGIQSGLVGILSGSVGAQVSGAVQISGLVGVQSGLVGIVSGVVGILSGQVQLLPNTSGGYSNYRNLWPNNISGVNVKATPGQVVGWYFYNQGASGAFVKLHDTSLAANQASSLIVATLPVPPSGGVAAPPSSVGFQFSSGIGVVVTTGAADTDTTAAVSGTVIVNLFYK